MIHVVAQGECLISLAERYGFFWKTLWEHDQNAELRALRKDPHVLLAGDQVFVPEKTLEEVQKPTGASHRFRRKGVPAKLRIQLLDENGPRANVPYVLFVDGVLLSADGARTDGDGFANADIPPQARSAELRLVPEGGAEEEYALQLGHVNPVETVSGQKQRLQNLGLLKGAIDEEETAEWREALAAFQAAQGLGPTGEPDEETLAKLRTAHDHV